jgi:hypothetical protein
VLVAPCNVCGVDEILLTVTSTRLSSDVVLCSTLSTLIHFHTTVNSTRHKFLVVHVSDHGFVSCESEVH